MAAATKTKKTTRKTATKPVETTSHTLYFGQSDEACNPRTPRYTFFPEGAKVRIRFYGAYQTCTYEETMPVAEARACYVSLLKLGWQKW